MRFTVLALDYDGTIAQESVLDPEVRRAIGEVRSHGITVVIATGRILSDLRRVAGDLRFVDAVVAENGAVVAFPETVSQSCLVREHLSVWQRHCAIATFRLQSENALSKLTQNSVPKR